MVIQRGCSLNVLSNVLKKTGSCSMTFPTLRMACLFVLAIVLVVVLTCDPMILMIPSAYNL